MSSMLSMMEARLPPGFRFHPRDEELVCDYLAGRASGAGAMMIDVDLNKCEPWDLPSMACVGGKEWYFFSLRDRKYATGQRTNRATQSGYWKATGKDRQVVRRGVLVGMRKTLVFYQGRAPKGKKSDWVMHEFRMEEAGDLAKVSLKEDWVLCRVFHKSRGISSKPSMGSSCYEETSSSTLPPLMDTCINFDQAPLFLQGFEQVPCFSNPTPPSYAAAPNLSPMQKNISTRNPAQLAGLPILGSCLNSLSSEKKVMKAVLSHLIKSERNKKSGVHSNLAEGSYFSDTGLPCIWNTF